MSSFYRKPEPANECGFSLVELAVAAGLAVALGAATIFILTNSGDAMKANSTQAASDADDYNQEVLGLYDDAKGPAGGGTGGGGTGGGGTGGNTAVAPTFAEVTAGATMPGSASMMGQGSWTSFSNVVVVEQLTPDGVSTFPKEYKFTNGPLAQNGTDLAGLIARSGVNNPVVFWTNPNPYTIVQSQYNRGLDKIPSTFTYYKMNADGEIIAW